MSHSIVESQSVPRPARRLPRKLSENNIPDPGSVAPVSPPQGRKGEVQRRKKKNRSSGDKWARYARKGTKGPREDCALREQGGEREDSEEDPQIAFEELGLSGDTIECLAKSAITAPKITQTKAIPLGKLGLDLIIESKRNTGKTTAAMILALETVIARTTPQILFLVPTAKVAKKTQEFLKKIAPHINTQYFTSENHIMKDMVLLSDCQMIVGTPGRILEHIQEGYLNVTFIKLLILDELEALNSMGMMDIVQTIISKLPPQQIIGMVESWEEKICEAVMKMMRDPCHVLISSHNRIMKRTNFYHYKLSELNFSLDTRISVLHHILSSTTYSLAIIHFNDQSSVTKSSEILGKEYNSRCISDNRLLVSPIKVTLKKNEKSVISRVHNEGIQDLIYEPDKINLIVNFDIPTSVNHFLSHIQSGKSKHLKTVFSIISENQIQQISNLYQLLNITAFELHMKHSSYSLSKSNPIIKTTQKTTSLLSISKGLFKSGRTSKEFSKKETDPKHCKSCHSTSSCACKHEGDSGRAPEDPPAAISYSPKRSLERLLKKPPTNKSPDGSSTPKPRDPLEDTTSSKEPSTKHHKKDRKPPSPSSDSDSFCDSDSTSEEPCQNYVINQNWWLSSDLCSKTYKQLFQNAKNLRHLKDTESWMPPSSALVHRKISDWRQEVSAALLQKTESCSPLPSFSSPQGPQRVISPAKTPSKPAAKAKDSQSSTLEPSSSSSSSTTSSIYYSDSQSSNNRTKQSYPSQEGLPKNQFKSKHQNVPGGLISSGGASPGTPGGSYGPLPTKEISKKVKKAGSAKKGEKVGVPSMPIIHHYHHYYSPVPIAEVPLSFPPHSDSSQIPFFNSPAHPTTSQPHTTHYHVQAPPFGLPPVVFPPLDSPPPFLPNAPTHPNPAPPHPPFLTSPNGNANTTQPIPPLSDIPTPHYVIHYHYHYYLVPPQYKEL